MKLFMLIRKLISPLILLSIASKYKGRAALMKIKAAQTYVAGVMKIRILFLGFLLMMSSFVLLGSGLFLIHTALFTYSSWSVQVKFITALVLGGIEFVGAIMIFDYLFREETWVKFYGIEHVLNSVIESTSDNKKA